LIVTVNETSDVPELPLALCRQGKLAEANAILESMAAAPSVGKGVFALLAVVSQLLGDQAAANGNFEAAIGQYNRSLSLRPNHFQPHYNKGVVLYQLNRKVEAQASFEATIALEPRFAEAYSALGVIQSEANEHPLALRTHATALALNPRSAEVHNNFGLALDRAYQHAEAVLQFDAAIALSSNYPAAWINRGVALHLLERLEEALASVDRALAIDPNDAEAWAHRALVLNDLKRHTEALSSYDHSLAIDPSSWQRHGDRLHTAMQACDWSGLAEAIRRVIDGIERGVAAITPFALLSTPATAAIQRRNAELYVSKHHPAKRVTGETIRTRHERIRLGYFSADFHEHATMNLMAEVFEQHDHARFELVAFSFGPDKGDPMRARAKAAFDRFEDVRSCSDEEVAALARSLEVDIAIDLKGFTENARPGIFAARAAPLQVSYLGYPGTMGASYIDYLVADQTVVPMSSVQDYAEHIAWLPTCYQANSSWGGRLLPVTASERSELALPRQAFVFCSFNNNYKISPDIFEVWMRLLRQIPHSVLWLIESNPDAAANLRTEAQRRGVDAERLVFAKRTSYESHLERHQHADLFLDTLHYGAHTTASDALRSGLPVLTCLGTTFASRVASSLCRTVGLDELVTDNIEDYEDTALTLARNPDRLGALRARLRESLASSSLFDPQGLARTLERLFEAMYDRFQSGLAPAQLGPL
jgi:predicted O-linked N-acetylglucosamine transferase (SPINDLY family)